MLNDPMSKCLTNTSKGVFIGCITLLFGLTFLVFFFLFIFHFWSYCFAESPTFKSSHSPEILFTGYTALFSGLAFSGIIISLFIQRADFNLQKLEMKAARNEYTIKRITEIIYHQVDIIDKTFLKLPYYHLNYDYGPTYTEEIINNHYALGQGHGISYPKISLTSNTGIEGIYKFIDQFKYTTNDILTERDFTVENSDRNCILNNYTSMKQLGGSIIRSIEIIDNLFNGEELIKEKEKLFQIFQVSIGQEILLFLKFMFIIANKYISESEENQSNNEDLKILKEIGLFRSKFIKSFLLVDETFNEYLNNEIS